MYFYHGSVFFLMNLCRFSTCSNGCTGPSRQANCSLHWYD